MLKARGIYTALLTRGDRKVQLQRLAEADLAELFTSVTVVDEKTAEKYTRISVAAHATPGQTWVVGNSYKTDIAPARRAGMMTILVPRHTWDYDKGRLARTDLIAHDLRRVSTFLLRLVSGHEKQAR